MTRPHPMSFQRPLVLIGLSYPTIDATRLILTAGTPHKLPPANLLAMMPLIERAAGRQVRSGLSHQRNVPAGWRHQS